MKNMDASSTLFQAILNQDPRQLKRTLEAGQDPNADGWVRQNSLQRGTPLEVLLANLGPVGLDERYAPENSDGRERWKSYERAFECMAMLVEAGARSTFNAELDLMNKIRAVRVFAPDSGMAFLIQALDQAQANWGRRRDFFFISRRTFLDEIWEPCPSLVPLLRGGPEYLAKKTPATQALAAPDEVLLWATSPAQRLLERRQMTKEGTFLEMALRVAVVGNERTKVALLLQAGANVNHADLQGNTVLMLACSALEIDRALVQLLIESGADVGAENKTGASALNRAGQHRKGLYDPEVVSLLVQAGAQQNDAGAAIAARTHVYASTPPRAAESEGQASRRRTHP